TQRLTVAGLTSKSRATCCCDRPLRTASTMAWRRFACRSVCSWCVPHEESRFRQAYTRSVQEVVAACRSGGCGTWPITRNTTDNCQKPTWSISSTALGLGATLPPGRRAAHRSPVTKLGLDPLELAFQLSDRLPDL